MKRIHSNEELTEIEIFSDLWHRHAYAIARQYAPHMYPCGKCNYPVASGYCCTYCGNINPSSATMAN